MKIKHNRAKVRIDKDADSWYDLWHVHTDFNGDGNQSKEARQACLEHLRGEYLSALEQLRDCALPNQSWVLIDPTDSGQDAVYVHTPNPNKENFPYTFEGVSWVRSKVPTWISKVFSSADFRLGRSTYKGHVMYWALSPRKAGQDAPNIHRA